MATLRLHDAHASSEPPTPAALLRLHGLRMEMGPHPSRHLRLHSVGVNVTTRRPPAQLLITEAGLLVGTMPDADGAVWVWLDGQWQRCEAYVRVGGQWL